MITEAVKNDLKRAIKILATEEPDGAVEALQVVQDELGEASTNAILDAPLLDLMNSVCLRDLLEVLDR